MSEYFRDQINQLNQGACSWSEIFQTKSSCEYILFDCNFTIPFISQKCRKLLIIHANVWKKKQSGDYFVDWLLCACVILNSIEFIVNDLCTDTFEWYHRFIIQALSPTMINLTRFHSTLVDNLDWACRWHRSLRSEILYKCASTAVSSCAATNMKKIMVVHISEKWPREVCQLLLKNNIFKSIMKTEHVVDSKCTIAKEIPTTAHSHAELCTFWQLEKEMHEQRKCRCVCACVDCWFRPCSVLADMLVNDLRHNHPLTAKNDTEKKKDVQKKKVQNKFFQQTNSAKFFFEKNCVKKKRQHMFYHEFHDCYEDVLQSLETLFEDFFSELTNYIAYEVQKNETQKKVSGLGRYTNREHVCDFRFVIQQIAKNVTTLKLSITTGSQHLFNNLIKNVKRAFYLPLHLSQQEMIQFSDNLKFIVEEDTMQEKEEEQEDKEEELKEKKQRESKDEKKTKQEKRDLTEINHTKLKRKNPIEKKANKGRAETQKKPPLPILLFEEQDQENNRVKDLNLVDPITYTCCYNVIYCERKRLPSLVTLLVATASHVDFGLPEGSEQNVFNAVEHLFRENVCGELLRLAIICVYYLLLSPNLTCLLEDVLPINEYLKQNIYKICNQKTTIFNQHIQKIGQECLRRIALLEQKS